MTAISWTKGNAPRKYTRRALFFDSLVIPKEDVSEAHRPPKHPLLVA